MQKVQLGAAIGETFRFIGEAWRGAWGAMILLVWLAAMVQAVEVLKPDWVLFPLLAALIVLFVTTGVTGALYRLRFSGDHPGDAAYAPGPGGLQWGGLEWRVLGANLLVGLMLGFIGVVAFFLWAIVLGVTVGSNTALAQAIENGTQSEKMAALVQIMLGPAGILSAIVLIPSIVGLIYLGARFTTFAPLAADARSFDFGKAWTLTRGAVGAVLVTMLVIYLVEFLVGAVVGFVIGVAGGATGHADQVKLWVSIVGQAVGAAINVPLFSGLQLYIYRTQRGDTQIASTFA